MATIAKEMPQHRALKALPLLKDLIVNHTVGAHPEELIRSVEDRYEVPLRDMLDAAVGTDREESRELEVRALAQAAYIMGKRDGARILASRRGLSSDMTRDDYEAIRAVADEIPLPAGAYQRVYAAFRQGMEAAAAIVYVHRNYPMDRRAQVAEARTVKSMLDMTKAEDLVDRSLREIDAAGLDFDSRVIAHSAVAVSRETADRVAEESLKRRVDEVVRTAPDLTAAQALQRARLAYRAADPTGELSQSAWGRAAWATVPLSDIEGVAASARADVYDPQEHTQPRTGSART